MNPDTGRFHAAMSEMETTGQQKRRLENMLEEIAVLVRSPQVLAEDVPEAGLKRGDPIPEGWPRFEVGELIPIKGFHFKLERIEDNCLVLKFHGMTKAEQRRRKQGP